MDSSDDDQPFNIRDGLEEESDEDSLRPHKRRKTHGSSGTTSLRARGSLAFVQSTSTLNQNNNEDDGDGEDQDEEDEEDIDDARPTMGGFRGFQLGSFEPPADPSPSPEMRQSPGPSKPIGAGQSAFVKGKVNKNSFAARMMAKMGHVEGQGLGKDGKGIAAPIEAQKLQVGTGLGFGAQQPAVPRPKTVRDKDTRKIASGASTPRLKAPPKKRYEVTAIESRGLHVPDSLKNIIDATGAENKRLDSLSGYSTPTSESARVTTEEEKRQARIKRDLTLFADAWDGQLQEADALSQEFENKDIESKHYAEQQTLFSNLITSFERVSVDDSQQPREFDQVITRLQQIQQDYADYIAPLDLPELAVATLSQPFQTAITDWDDPLSDHGSELVSHLSSISTLLELERSTHSRHRKRTTTFESLLLKSFYPLLRDVFRNSWSVYDPTSARSFIETWYPSVMPAWMLYKLFQELVIPKLIEAVKRFKPAKDGHKRHSAPDLHEWLFDWWVLLDSDLAPESFTQLKIEIKSKVRFDDRVWPKWEPLLGSHHKPKSIPVVQPVTVETPPVVLEDEMTFKDILEEWCIENDLMLRNTGAADGLGRRLMRLIPAGKNAGGILIYVQDDVVFESATGDPFMLDEELAEKARSGR